MIRRFTFVMLTTLGLVLVLGACGGSDGSEEASQPDDSETTDVSAQDVVDDMTRAFQGLEDFTGSVEVEFTEPQDISLSMDVWMDGSLIGGMIGDLPDFRGEVTSSDVSLLPEDTVVVFASDISFYDPTQNVVFTASQERGGSGSQLFRLPLMFFSSMSQALQFLNSSDVDKTVAGEEEIGSFNTIKIEATPAGSDGPLGEDETYTVWIDTETNMPVQMVYDTADGEQRLTVTSMEVNAGVESSVFTFETPEGATVQDVSAPQDVADLEEAADVAGFAPPTPGYLPEGLSEEPSTVQVHQTPLGNMILQTYSTEADETDPEGNPATISVNIDTLYATNGLPERLPTSLPPGAESSEVDINGQTGILMSLGEGQASLSWQDGDTVYTIRGSGYGAEEVQQIAEELVTE